MADEAWPRLTKPLWSGFRVMLVIALLLQLLIIYPSSQELWTGVITPEMAEADVSILLVGLAALALLVIWIFVFIVCIVYTARVTVRMMKNLNALDAPGERMSPTMAVVWYFIPIANLYLPYRAVKQIWRDTFELTAEPGPDDGVIALWWWCWVLSNITGTWSFRMSMESGGMSEFGPHNVDLYIASLWVGLASSVLGALACWFMLKTFGPLSRAQDEVITARGGVAAG